MAAGWYRRSKPYAVGPPSAGQRSAAFGRQGEGCARASRGSRERKDESLAAVLGAGNLTAAATLNPDCYSVRTQEGLEADCVTPFILRRGDPYRSVCLQNDDLSLPCCRGLLGRSLVQPIAHPP